MKLSTIVTDYRKRMQISQREFARRCGLSNSYISFIENENNPRTGKPIVPTLEQYQKIAACMDMTVHQLFEMLDEDSPVFLRQPPTMDLSLFGSADYVPVTTEAKILARDTDKLPPEEREQLLSLAHALYAKYEHYFEKEGDDGTGL